MIAAFYGPLLPSVCPDICSPNLINLDCVTLVWNALADQHLLEVIQGDNPIGAGFTAEIKPST